MYCKFLPVISQAPDWQFQFAVFISIMSTLDTAKTNKISSGDVHLK